MRTVVGTDRDRPVLQLLGLVNAALWKGDEGHPGHGGAQRDDFRRTLPGLDGLNRALHHPPFTHPVLVQAAPVIETFQATVEDLGAERLPNGIGPRGTGGLNHFHVQPLVPEEPLITGHQHGQVMHHIHHRHAYLRLFRLDRHSYASLSESLTCLAPQTYVPGSTKPTTGHVVSEATCAQRRGISPLCALTSRLKSSPPGFPQPVVPRPSHRETPEPHVQAAAKITLRLAARRGGERPRGR